MDLLDLWESIQFGPIEDEAATALHSPEPLRWVDPDLYRGFVSSSTSESGSDDSWGFWGPPNVEELARIMGREQDRADCMGGAESSGLDGTPRVVALLTGPSSCLWRSSDTCQRSSSTTRIFTH